ncbi:type I secretion system permease/ATPase [Thauera sp.]|jgi:ATP-binding cassette subfamily C exporter for protease/lipase|uniref:type I secretion system permease/ATPase n=1 Tax=Thauera sp. TaxID=1905334 RepID=UPI00263320EB|nr:type I secretion system permease/ATPase [Thauera sp.]MCK6409331.1 type I secretion system permease/ATPase [Thauera sp.]
MAVTGFFARSELAATLYAFRREFLIVGIFSMVANVLMLAPTLYMLQIYDRVLVSRSELTLLVVSLITLFFFAVMAFAEWSRSRLLVRAGVRLDAVLSTRVFNASFEANLSQSGAPAQRAFNDLTEVRQFLTGNGIFTFFDAPWAPIYIGVLFFLHPFLGWTSIGFALVQAALAWFGHRRTIVPSEQASKAALDVNLYLQGKLRNAEVVESMGMLSGLRERWAGRHAEYMERQGAAQGLTHRIGAISKWVRYCQQSLALAAGALLVIEGELTAGGMIAANVLMSRALAPIDQMVNTWRSFISARTAFLRLETLLQAHPERDPALSRVPPSGEMELRDVVASAPGRAEPILHGVSLHARPGSVTVVLGPSGSGKSTLARVLMGIWPDVSGEVLLDGHPLDGWSRAELGPHVGYLPQDIELFDGTIAENIARFAEVESDKVIAAARSAGLHDMILRFPKGYDTPMGEAGSLLSGGQRQRVGLARAIYGDPALIVLDEPNANLDDVGEAALMRAVRELRDKGRTVFLITHRPGAIAVADQLLVLRDGRVLCQGSRDAVLTWLQAQARPPAAAPAPAPAPSAAPPAPALG